MRFIHTADWQIGMKATHVGAIGSEVREQRLRSARRAVEVANELRADFMVVAGDTFENNAVERVLVQRVADIVAGFHGPVFLLSGNHDPLSPGSVWDHPAWESHRNLRVLRKAEPLEVPGGVLFPCPVFEKYSQRDPTRWIDATAEKRVAIGVAHGTVKGLPTDELDYPIERVAAEVTGLDYLALGHWHSYASFPNPNGVARVVYSGTHETTRFGERDSGNVLFVEIDERGAPPKVTPHRTGGLTWRVIEENLVSPEDAERVRRMIEGIEAPQQTLLDVRLAGFLFPLAQPELTHLGEIIRARFLFGRVDDSALGPPPNDDWLDQLPHGLLRDVAEELKKNACGLEAAGATPRAVSQRALLELHRVWSEVQR